MVSPAQPVGKSDEEAKCMQPQGSVPCMLVHGASGFALVSL